MSAVGDARKRLAERTQPDPTASAVRAAQAEAWGEAVQAVAWCLDNGEPSPAAALAYVAKNNSYRADHLATDTAAPERSCREHPHWSGMSNDCLFCKRDAAAPVAVEGVETVRVGFRYQDGEVLSPEREGLSRDKELPVVVLDLGDGEWLTLSEVRSLSPVEPETSEPEGGDRDV